MIVFARTWSAPAAGAGAEGELPCSIPDGEVAVDGLADDVVANGGSIRAEQGWEEADAIFACCGRQGRADEFGKGGHEIDLPDELVGHRAGFHLGWPAGDERDAVAAFVEICFVTPVDVAGLVSGGLQLGDVGGRGAAVVGGEDYQRVFRKALGFERSHQAAHVGIDLFDEVGIGTDAAAALKFGAGNDGRVWRGEGHVGEEGLAFSGGGSAFADVGDGVVEDAALHVNGFKFFSGGTFAEEGFFGGGDLGGQAIFDPDKREHVE